MCNIMNYFFISLFAVIVWLWIFAIIIFIIKKEFWILDFKKDIGNFSYISKNLNNILISFIPFIAYFDYMTKNELKPILFWLTLVIFLAIPIFYIFSIIFDDFKEKPLEKIILFITWITIAIISIVIWLDVWNNNVNNLSKEYYNQKHSTENYQILKKLDELMNK